MSEPAIPKAVWQGEIVMLGVPLKCFVLDDGRRIIEADSVDAFLIALESATHPTDQRRDGALEFTRFCRGSGIPTYEMKDK